MITNSEHRATIAALKTVAHENPQAREFVQRVTRAERVRARIQRLKGLIERTKDENAVTAQNAELVLRERELAYLADKIEAGRKLLPDFDLAKAITELGAEDESE